jgi:hypothetical protein
VSADVEGGARFELAASVEGSCFDSFATRLVVASLVLPRVVLSLRSGFSHRAC